MHPSTRGRGIPYTFTALDTGVRREPFTITASDGVQSFAILYRPERREPRHAVYLTHPRAEFARHYAVPDLVARGYAVLGHNSRYLNNDTDAVHERLLFDIAAALRDLRDRGYERIILLGNSGGGSLLGFYQQQASRAAAARIASTPAGEPVDLAGEDMPQGDVYLAVASHPGEGHFLLNVLDPSVIDEQDPLAVDPAWDMYDARNGYRPYPEPSAYDAGWLAAYRQRQRDRNERLDQVARAAIADQQEARSATRAEGFRALASEEQSVLTRRRWLGRYMVIYRTLANPAYLDPAIDPSNRPLGSIFSPGDPIIGNYGPLGFARVMTPRAWLSTASGLSSQAELSHTIQEITLPTLIVQADGDTDIFPSEQRMLLERSAASDKSLVELEHADHYLYPLGDAGARLAHPRERLMDIIVPWMKARLGEP